MIHPWRLLIPIVLGLLIPVSAGGTLRHVNAEGSGNFPTIQSAVDASADGDTVLCAPGIYTGSGNFSIYFHGTDLVLLSVAGPEATVIDCEGIEPRTALYFTGGETRNAIVDGFTIRYCINAFGGGIRIGYFSSVTLRNLIIEECWGGTFGGSGGGIFASDSSLLLEDSTIRNCWSEDGGGGGMRCTGDGLPELRRVVFAGNRTLGGGGGLIVSTTLAPIMEDLVFRDNEASVGGGLDIGVEDSLQITGLVFEGNRAGRGVRLGQSR